LLDGIIYDKEVRIHSNPWAERHHRPEVEGDEPEACVDGTYRRPGRWLLGWLWHCTDVLPEEYTDLLDMPKGTTYGEAVQHIRQSLYDPLLDGKQILTRLRTEFHGLDGALEYYLRHLVFGWSFRDVVKVGPASVDGLPLSLLEVCATIVSLPEHGWAATSKMERRYGSALGIEGDCTYLTAASTILEMYDRVYNRVDPRLSHSDMSELGLLDYRPKPSTGGAEGTAP
jgi:hypothetical protein